MRALLLLTSLTTLAAGVGAQELPPPPSGDYIIGEGDVLDIRVTGAGDISGKYTVRLDGLLVFPYLGEIKAAGLALGDFNRLLVSGLSEYYKNPQVTVEVADYTSCVVYVLGEVEKPGVYKFKGRTTLLETIAEAGGYTSRAARASTMVVRSFPDQPQVMRIDMAKVVDDGAITLNISLQKGDVVVVPKTFIANLNQFLEDITPSLAAYLRANTVYRTSWER